MTASVKLLFIGDSLIEFFDWQGRFPEFTVWNRGLAGETVEGLHARLASVSEKMSVPDFVFIMTGINNLAMEDTGFVRTYRDLLRKIRALYPDAGVFLHSLLPVDFPWISNRDITGVNVQLRALAEEEDVSYIDLHSEFFDEKGELYREYLLDDGVHLSEAGYRVWSESIASLLA